MFASRARLLVAALWAGSLWTIGYVVAPTLFLSLHDNAQAGTIVGMLLKTEAWLAMACAVILYALVKFGDIEPARKRSLAMIITAMLVCALVIYLGLQPVMAQMRASGLKGTSFGLLHGVSQLFYLLESVLAGVLLVKLR